MAQKPKSVSLGGTRPAHGPRDQLIERPYISTGPLEAQHRGHQISLGARLSSGALRSAYIGFQNSSRGPFKLTDPSSAQ